jgi:hypothetical protein
MQEWTVILAVKYGLPLMGVPGSAAKLLKVLFTLIPDDLASEARFKDKYQAKKAIKAPVAATPGTPDPNSRPSKAGKLSLCIPYAVKSLCKLPPATITGLVGCTKDGTCQYRHSIADASKSSTLEAMRLNDYGTPGRAYRDQGVDYKAALKAAIASVKEGIADSGWKSP